MTQPIYFDLTDIVRYAVSNNRVTGIQRVQVNLVGHLARKHGSDKIRCVFFHPELRCMVEVESSGLFSSPDFNSSAMLQQLRIESITRYLPSRNKLKAYLLRFDHNKALRTWKKLDVYVSAFAMPSRLAALGLERQQTGVKALRLDRIEALPRGASYVFLSANVAVEQVVQFARRHAAQGGDLVQVVYDLIPHKRPDLFTPSMAADYAAWLIELRSLRPRAICISAWTARDLRESIGDPAGWKIAAIRMAHEFDGYVRNAAPPPLAAGDRLPAQPFVLCVGTLEVRKNGLGLLRAWQALLGDPVLGETILVFAGKRGWMMQAFDELLAGDSALRERVRFVEAPSDAELAWLYRRCLFTVYPSHYEGWGLPVGEAAWFGRHCIASNASSIPEVLGELADYIDPDKPQEIADRIRFTLAHPDHLDSRESAIRGATLRSWSDVADDIYRIVTDMPAVDSIAAPSLVQN